MKSRFIVMLLIVGFTLLGACGGQQPASATTTTTGTIPNDLQTIEGAAEDIIDFAPNDNWDKISADVADISSAWKAYQPLAGQAGASQELQNAMTSALTQLQAASASKDPAATMQASNNVSAAVVEMFALYHPKIPADIGRLDVIERQVILDIAAQDYVAAEASLSRAKSVWESVKSSALANNGKKVVEQFEASLAAQASALAAKDAAALTDEARHALEIVDQLEQLY
ncbi:MAG TPA: hypothetical protein VLE49_19485 [Anaerolineales bacterium]|nr:hypothetical protein [Anaerolineales bacterium]